MPSLAILAPRGARNFQLLGIERDYLQSGAHRESIEPAASGFSLTARPRYFGQIAEKHATSVVANSVPLAKIGSPEAFARA